MSTCRSELVFVVQCFDTTVLNVIAFLGHSDFDSLRIKAKLLLIKEKCVANLVLLSSQSYLVYVYFYDDGRYGDMVRMHCL